MDSRVRTGSDLECEYGGKPSGALIKLYGEEDKETGWLSAEVLEQALKLVRSAEEPKPLTRQAQAPVAAIGNPAFLTEPAPPVVRMPDEARVVSAHQAGVGEIPVPAALQSAPPPGPAPRIPGRTPTKVPVETVQSFAEECAELVANPPKSRENEREGVGEQHIRELITRYSGAFSANPNQMFTPLRKYFNLDKGRFEVILEGIALSKKKGRARV